MFANIVLSINAYCITFVYTFYKKSGQTFDFVTQISKQLNSKNFFLHLSKSLSCTRTLRILNEIDDIQSRTDFVHKLKSCSRLFQNLIWQFFWYISCKIFKALTYHIWNIELLNFSLFQQAVFYTTIMPSGNTKKSTYNFMVKPWSGTICLSFSSCFVCFPFR